MKQSLQTIIKVILLFLIGFTLFLYFLPISTEIPEEILNPVQKGDDTDKKDVEAEEITLQDSDQVAVLFGWIRPTPTPPPRVTAVPTATPIPTPITPGWLKYIGGLYMDNVQKYGFKDERNTIIFYIAKGVSDKGWSLIKVTPEGYFLENDGKEYFVTK